MYIIPIYTYITSHGIKTLKTEQLNQMWHMYS